MALTREEQELVLRVKGSDDVARLSVEIGKEERAVRDAIRAHDAGTLALAAYESQVQRSTAALTQHHRDLGKAQSATRDYQINIQAAGYALNDFLTANGGLAQQINSVSNNLPNMLKGLGNIGPILSGLVPLGVLIASSWEPIMKLFGQSEESIGGNIERIKKSLEELEKKPVKLAVDIHELETLRTEISDIERAIKEVDALRHGQKDEERASGKAIGDAIANSEGGSQGVLAAVRPDFIRLAQGQSQTIRDADQKASIARAEIEAIKNGKYADSLETALMKGAEAAKAIKEAEESRRLAMAEIRKEGGGADTAFGKMVAVAKTGSGVAQKNAQEQLMAILGAHGMGDLAGEIKDASPAAMADKENDKILAKVDELIVDVKKEIAANDKKTKGIPFAEMTPGQRETLASDLTKQGNEIQNATFLDLAKTDKRAAVKFAKDAARGVKKEETAEEKKKKKDAKEKAAFELAESKKVEMFVLPGQTKTLAELAIEDAMRIRQAGGKDDEYGRFQKMNLSQQSRAVQAKWAADLKAAGLKNVDTFAVAKNILGPAFEAVDGPMIENGVDMKPRRPAKRSNFKQPKRGGFQSVGIEPAAQPQGPNAADLAHATAGRDGAMMDALGQQGQVVSMMVNRLNGQENWLRGISSAMAGQQGRLRNNKSIR